MVHYLQVLPDNSIGRGILFDCQGCHLIEMKGQQNHKVVTYHAYGKWDTPGLSNSIIKFAEVTSKMDSVLSQSLTHHQLTLDSFLGAGGFGRVYRVVDRNGEIRALKVSSSPNLNNEFAWMEKLMKEAEGRVVPVIENSFVQFSEGACYLLAQVGEPVKRIRSEVMSACRALDNLHASGYCHGDARFQNIIKVNSQLLWIDLMFCVPKSAAAQLKDFKYLISSFLRIDKVCLYALCIILLDFLTSFQFFYLG